MPNAPSWTPAAISKKPPSSSANAAAPPPTKRLANEMKEGLVAGRISNDGRLGVLVRLGCQTDFVARNDGFLKLLGDLVDLAFENSVNTPADLNALKYPDGTGRTVEQVIKELVGGTIKENIGVTGLARFDSHTGRVEKYVHHNGKVAALIQIDGSTDDAVKVLAGEIAMHIAAGVPQVPLAVDRTKLDPAVVEKEKAAASEGTAGKPPNIVEKIVAGKLEKYFQDAALVDQTFVKDENKRIRDLLADTGKAVGTPYDRPLRPLQSRRSLIDPQKSRDASRGFFYALTRSTTHAKIRDVAVASLDPAAMPDAKYRRVLLKISGEGFCHEGGFGIEADELENIAKQCVEVCKTGVELGDRRRRRKLHPRRDLRRGRPHPPRHRRLHGHARHRHQRPGAPGDDGKDRPAHPRACPPSASTASASRSSAAAPSATWKKAAPSSSPPAPATPSSPPTPAPPSAPPRSKPTSLLKATKVDGIYTADPKKDPTAKLYHKITYEQVHREQLRVMDLTAITLCMERQDPAGRLQPEKARQHHPAPSPPPTNSAPSSPQSKVPGMLRVPSSLSLQANHNKYSSPTSPLPPLSICQMLLLRYASSIRSREKQCPSPHR